MKAAAIILAAGEGSRMKSKHAKVAHTILGKSMVNWVVDAAREAGTEHVITVVGYGREEVVPLVENYSATVVQEKQLGTAHAVMQCKAELEGFDGPVVVLNGDSPLITSDTIMGLIAMREVTEAAAVVLTMMMEDPTGYGRIIRDECGNVERIVEQKDAKPEEAAVKECNSGFYCFDGKVLFEALEQVKCNNAQCEYYLTDVLEICRKMGRRVVAQVVADPSECLGVNTRVQLAAAAKAMQRRVNEKYMLEGVSMLDPSSTWISPGVLIGRDTCILPGTIISGRSVIGEDCVIGPHVHLDDALVEDGAVVADSVTEI